MLDQGGGGVTGGLEEQRTLVEWADMVEHKPERSWPSSDSPTEECMMEPRKKQVSDPVENTQVTVTVTNDVVNLEKILMQGVQ